MTTTLNPKLPRLEDWPTNVSVDPHDPTQTWALHNLTTDQARKCMEALRYVPPTNPGGGE